MNRLFGRVLDDVGKETNVGNFETALLRIESLNDGNWDSKNGKYGKLGTGIKDINNLYDDLEMEFDTSTVS